MSAVHIHIGGAGLHMAESVWDCLCSEHGIDLPTGSPLADAAPSPFYFQELRSGKYRARAVLADLESQPIEGMQGLGVVTDDRKTWGFEGAGFSSRGIYTVGKEQCEDVLRLVAAAAEECAHCSSFFLYCSMLGGTGSGLSYILHQRLKVDYPKTTVATVAVFPSSTSNVVVEPFNFFQCSPLFVEGDLTIAVNNDALYQLTDSGGNYTQANEPIAQMTALLNSPQTHDSWHHFDLQMLTASLVTYPRINVVVPSLSPVGKGSNTEPKALFGVKDAEPALSFRSTVITNSVAAMTCWDIEERLTASPSCFDVVTRQRPQWRGWASSDSSSLYLSNSSLLRQCYKRVAEAWDSLYSKRAYVHWYAGEGLESGEMCERREDMAALIRDYEEVVATAMGTNCEGEGNEED